MKLKIKYSQCTLFPVVVVAMVVVVVAMVVVVVTNSVPEHDIYSK